MFLEKLTIENYGLYAQKNEFDLSCTPDKPIVLVGGFNGAGKTTILESLMVALYGRTFFGLKKSKKEYLNFIYHKIHRSNNKRADQASIQIAFRFYHNGSDDRYVINRYWEISGASVTEYFSVEKNGNIMTDIDESQWQSFIEGLIPLGIAKLFFFDGEKIVRITDDGGQYNKEIKTSIETLIGADLIQQLRADLNLFMLRKSDDRKNAITKEYDNLNHEKEDLTSDIESLSAELEKKSLQVDAVNKEINEKESSVSGIGGGYADIRSDLLRKKAVLDERIRTLTKQIHEELSDDAPFYLISPMLKKIQAQIKKDNEILVKTASNMSLDLIVSEMQKKMNKSEFWPENVDGNLVAPLILDMIKEIETVPKGKIAFDLSTEDTQYIMQLVRKIHGGYASLSNTIREYTKNKEELGTVESSIAKIPKDDELGPRITEINALHQEVGTLNAEIEHIEQKISSKQIHRKILQSKLKNMLNAIHSSKNATASVKMASKMQEVLEKYYVSLKEKKIKELESHLLYTAKLLLHKKSIHRMEIDRDAFEIKAYESDDHIPGDFLSMGERQIVGTALLWAIARTCGRSLPFIIDTPLGRLDGQHLLNLTEKFYPHASHQIVLLSTDREIGTKEYDKMSPSISRSYRITCDENRSVTTVTSGYFVEKELA